MTSNMVRPHSVVNLLSVCLLFVSLSTVFGQKNAKERMIRDQDLSQRWLTASYDFDNIIFPHKDYLISILDDVSKDKNLTNQFRMFDSSVQTQAGSRTPNVLGIQISGLAHGYISDLGNREECLGIRVKGDNQLQGQYCLVNLKFPSTPTRNPNWVSSQKLDLTGGDLEGTIYEHFGNHSEIFHHEHHTFALCTPAGCSEGDIGAILSTLTGDKELKAELKSFVPCEVYEPLLEYVQRQPMHRYLSLMVVIFMMALVAVSTVITYFLGEETSFKHFSMARNVTKLCTNYKDPYLQRMKFLDTFKFWYHTGGLFAHMVGFVPLVPLVFGIMQDSDSLQEQWVVTEWAKKAIYTTQLIFLISGMFSCYFIYPIIAKNNGKMSFISYAFKRWLRTAPTTAGMILLMFASACLMRGPLAGDLLHKYVETCKTDWWRTMLYINNYQTFSTICIPTSWSQSVDFHLWLLAYFPLIWLYKKPKLGIAACFALIGLGIAIPAGVMLWYEMPSTTSGRPIDMLYYMLHGNYFPLMHLGTHNNMASYFLGVLLGYCFAIEWRPFKGVISLAIFCNSLQALTVVSVFGPYVWVNILGFTMSRVMDAIYCGFFRITYLGLFAATFIFQFFEADTCRKYLPGYKLLMDSDLYVPLGRLSYSVFLSQLIPMAWYLTISYEEIPVNRYYMGFRFLPVMFCCFLFGFFMFIVFEAPFISIAKTYLNKQNMTSDSINHMENEKLDNTNHKLLSDSNANVFNGGSKKAASAENGETTSNLHKIKAKLAPWIIDVTFGVLALWTCWIYYLHRLNFVVFVDENVLEPSGYPAIAINYAIAAVVAYVAKNLGSRMADLCESTLRMVASCIAIRFGVDSELLRTGNDGSQPSGLTLEQYDGAEQPAASWDGSEDGSVDQHWQGADSRDYEQSLVDSDNGSQATESPETLRNVSPTIEAGQ
ncbi:hypothetical protein HDE_06628 [Halotydeus destructor]|nr:hypothetical protein HDE_06628 [Halotydeus destructor]